MKVYKVYVDANYSSSGVLIAADNLAAAREFVASHNADDENLYRQYNPPKLVIGLKAAPGKTRVAFVFGHRE